MNNLKNIMLKWNRIVYILDVWKVIMDVSVYFFKNCYFGGLLVVCERVYFFRKGLWEWICLFNKGIVNIF